MSVLDNHAKQKQDAVNGWDIVSSFLGITGLCLLGSACIQPGHSLNQFRLPGALLLFGASAAAERLRETDLASLDRAVQFRDSIKTERIKRAVLHEQALKDLEEEEQLFQLVPRDRWGAVAEKLGLTPPNYEIRNQQQAPQIPEPLVQGLPQSAAVMEADPCVDGYDPEKDKAINDCIIFAEQVAQWFEDRLAILPESLIKEWKADPGYAIQVKDGVAKILRS